MQTIWQRIKTPKGWRYQSVEEGRGKRTGDLQPPFYVRPTVSGKQSWQLLKAETFAEARQEAEQFDAVLAAAAKGLTVREAEALSNANRIPLKTAIDKYLETKADKSRKTVLQYTGALRQFLEILTPLRIKFLDQITKDVLRRYKAQLVHDGYSNKTIDTRLNVVYFMLKKSDSKVRLPNDELPTIEIEPAVPYTEEEVKKLLDSMDAEQRIRYQFFLGTGCRDREVSFASWKDINLEKRTYTVCKKEDVGFFPKSHESRTIPLPASLVEALKARRTNHPHDRWVFTNTEGNPDNHFLRKLKKIALRAGLNCGQCSTTINGKEVTCRTHPVCEHVYLHRFRKTCATRWQEHGIPLRTIQAWLGHKNLETTQRYLGVTDSGKLRPQIDAAFGD